MARKSVVIRLAGESGEGVISSGDILTQAAARGGYWTQTFRTYPAEIKGGPCMYQVRMGDEQIYSHGKWVDLLVCFNQEAWDLHWDSLAPDGVILYDETAVEIPEEYRPRARPVRMEKLAKEIGGSLRAKNMVAVGAVSGVISFDTTPIEELVLRRFAHKQGVADANIAALHAGEDEGADLKGSLAIVEPVEVEADRLLMSGNQAIALGAVAAGLKYFAGYPITPASDILEWLSAKLPQVGGITIQCEDEIASICSVLGASFAGQKAMTATSGPGLSLMTEVLGYAGTAEIPCVIIDAQRGGPSTGLPTKTEQSDLQHALYGGHGEAPRVVVAPVSVEDCFWTAIDAFNYSERFQVPVILLTDQGLATRMEVIHKPDTSGVELWERKTSAGWNGDYKRYAYTDDSVSPMGIPGEEGGQYVATGIEHDELGHPGYTPEIHVGMQTKRWAKLEPLRNGLARHVTHGDERPEIALIGFGSTFGPVREAVDRARAEGLSVGAFYPRVLGPFPAEQVRGFASGARRVIVPEVNFTGQLARLVRGECGIAVESHAKCDGLPFTAEDIYDAITSTQEATL
ncbi:MAG: 2-oxoacid:acceptor oxidoreductase subunit alpha [Phycisphaerales bacterium]|nr:2-oxoacid:acceptor oxidoreductase subunit alpha [Phycisphaerales bacterium]